MIDVPGVRPRSTALLVNALWRTTVYTSPLESGTTAFPLCVNTLLRTRRPEVVVSAQTPTGKPGGTRTRPRSRARRAHAAPCHRPRRARSPDRLTGRGATSPALPACAPRSTSPSRPAGIVTFPVYVPARTSIVWSLPPAALTAAWIELYGHPLGQTVKVAASAEPASPRRSPPGRRELRSRSAWWSSWSALSSHFAKRYNTAIEPERLAVGRRDVVVAGEQVGRVVAAP